MSLKVIKPLQCWMRTERDHQCLPRNTQMAAYNQSFSISKINVSSMVPFRRTRKAQTEKPDTACLVTTRMWHLGLHGSCLDIQIPVGCYRSLSPLNSNSGPQYKSKEICPWELGRYKHLRVGGSGCAFVYM